MIVELKVRGVREGEETLHQLALRAMHTQEAMKDIARELTKAEARQFDSQYRWKALTKATKARKFREYKDPRILRAKGSLHYALTSDTARARELGQLREVKNGELRFGLRGGRTDVFYGRFHQRGKGSNPVRIVVPNPTGVTRKAMRQVIRDHLLS